MLAVAITERNCWRTLEEIVRPSEKNTIVLRPADSRQRRQSPSSSRTAARDAAGSSVRPAAGAGHAHASLVNKNS